MTQAGFGAALGNLFPKLGKLSWGHDLPLSLPLSHG